MSVFLCRYNATKKINAIKSVRRVFNLGLKEAKDAVESEHGFLMTELQWIALRGEYLSGNLTRVSGANPLNTNDWRVETYIRRDPLDLTDNSCIGDRIVAQREHGSISEVGSVVWNFKNVCFEHQRNPRLRPLNEWEDPQ